MNGPAVAGRDSKVAVAWFTLGRERHPSLRLAWSTDQGRSFPHFRVVEEDTPLGRTAVSILADGSVVVSWIAERDEQGILKVRRFGAADDASQEGAEEPREVATLSSSRASGFPTLVALESEVLLAWTDITETSTVKVALLRFGE